MAVALALVLAGGLLPASILAAAPQSDTHSGLRPTIQYEEAVAHAHDRIAGHARGGVPGDAQGAARRFGVR